jgi:hypothetical protein
MRLLALFSIEEVFDAFQRGHMFNLKTRGADGQPLWANRNRLDTRSGRCETGDPVIAMSWFRPCRLFR